MITVTSISGYAFMVSLDKPDFKAIRKLSEAYGIPFGAMLVGCINRGIDVIGKQVQDTEKQEQETCEGG